MTHVRPAAVLVYGRGGLRRVTAYFLLAVLGGKGTCVLRYLPLRGDDSLRPIRDLPLLSRSCGCGDIRSRKG